MRRILNFFRNRNNTKLFLVKDRADKKYSLCPICGARLVHNYNEEHCSSHCGYANGLIRLTDKEAKKHKDKILAAH